VEQRTEETETSAVMVERHGRRATLDLGHGHYSGERDAVVYRLPQIGGFMSHLTDKNIEFYCPECQYMAVGKDDMLQHVRDEHPTAYNATERENAVQNWLEDAYVRQAEWMQNYVQERQLDRAIERDAFPNK